MTKSSKDGERRSVYVGLDVSKNETQLCVVDADGAKLFERKVATDPDALVRAIARTVDKHDARVELIGLEMGAMASWLWRELQAWSLPVVCIDARHAHAALSTRMNKTDRGDARGIAELMRTGWFREVAPRSEESQALRAPMVARSRLVRMRLDAQNQVRGLLKERGIRMPRAVGAMFRRRVREAMKGRLAEGDHLHVPIDTFLRLHERLCIEQNGIERRIRREAATDETTRRLMTIPGVGVMTATCFRQTIDDPHRFTSSATVGAYLELTPRRHQSGEMDWTGRISKRGSVTMRALLYEAATVIMHRVRRTCAMKRWAEGLAERIGKRRAKVALARKLAVMMHAIWIDGTEFDWGWDAGAATGAA